METLESPYKQGKVLLVDKPLNWTSFDVVKKIRGVIKTKIGHAGTLDPLATGLLICCTGKFTKKINEYQAQEKEYTGTFHLGAVTPTYDLETDPTDIKSIDEITPEKLTETLQKFTGSIQQVPPAHSAIKHKGKRAYELARKGEVVKLDPRTIEIKSFELTRIALPEVDFKVICSTGTYIRSLAHDFGQALGCGAYLSALRRTRIGRFTVEEAKDIADTVSDIQDIIRKDTPPQS